MHIKTQKQLRKFNNLDPKECLKILKMPHSIEETYLHQTILKHLSHTMTKPT
jgi:hypothetical protein